MALTRKFLAAMGIDEDKIDEIINAHGETVTALKEERDGYKEKADHADDIQMQLETANHKLDDATKDDGFKSKYETIEQEFADFKTNIEAEKSHAAKEKAVVDYLKSKGIADKSMHLATKYLGDSIDGIEVAEGKITDTKTLDDAIGGDLSALVVSVDKHGADTAAPPVSGGESGAHKISIPTII